MSDEGFQNYLINNNLINDNKIKINKILLNQLKLDNNIYSNYLIAIYYMNLDGIKYKYYIKKYFIKDIKKCYYFILEFDRYLMRGSMNLYAFFCYGQNTYKSKYYYLKFNLLDYECHSFLYINNKIKIIKQFYIQLFEKKNYYMITINKKITILFILKKYYI